MTESKAPKIVTRDEWERARAELLVREKERPGLNTGRDWIFLAIILSMVIAAAAIPIAILIWILRTQLH